MLINDHNGFLDKAGAVKEKAVEIIRFCEKATGEIAKSVVELIVANVLDGVVFPLTSLIFLIWLVRGTLYPAFGLSNRSLTNDDFGHIKTFLRAKNHEKYK